MPAGSFHFGDASLISGRSAQPCAAQPAGKHALNIFPSPGTAAERSAVRPAWITGCKLPPRPLLGVVLAPFEEVHVVTQEDE
jgi:hypothetical protein